MNCKQCGNELPNNAEFCSKCGFSFNNPQQQDPQTNNNLTPQPQQVNQPTKTPTSDTSAKRGLNYEGMIKWGFAGATVGFIFAFFAAYISWTAFWMTFISFILVFALIGAKSKTKEKIQQEAKQQFENNERLTTNEKITAWIFCIINPVIAGAIMYFMWRNKYPQKARQANNISIIVFVIESILVLFWVFSTAPAIE